MMSPEHISALTVALCVENTDYPASLELRKIYEILPDSDLDEGEIRVVDESGEDYIYPVECFVSVAISEPSGWLVRSLFDGRQKSDENAGAERKQIAPKDLRDALESLDHDHKRVLGLYFFEGLAFEDIASRLDLSLAASHRLLRNGLHELRLRVVALGPEDEELLERALAVYG